MPHVRIENVVSVCQCVPPEDVPVQKPGRNEKRRRQVSSGELLHTLVDGARIRIIESDRNARSGAAGLIDSIERHDLGRCYKQVELLRELSLRNEKRALSRGWLAIGNDAVIGEDQALPTESPLRQPPDGGPGDYALYRLLQETVHVLTIATRARQPAGSCQSCTLVC